MSNRLTRGELRIIEQTKRQGEELYGEGGTDKDGKNSEKKEQNKKSVRSLVTFALIFLLLALVVRLAAAWLSR